MTADLRVNGEPLDAAALTERGYATIRRRWMEGDRVELDLPMPVEWIYAHPSVSADAGRACLKRGPLVYCAEQIDNPGAALRHLRLSRAAPLAARDRADLFGGIVAVTAPAAIADAIRWGAVLYRTSPPDLRAAEITAIPYYLWRNRDAGEMALWLLES